jgi:hypothetical protein
MKPFDRYNKATSYFFSRVTVPVQTCNYLNIYECSLNCFINSNNVLCSIYSIRVLSLHVAYLWDFLYTDTSILYLRATHPIFLRTDRRGVLCGRPMSISGRLSAKMMMKMTSYQCFFKIILYLSRALWTLSGTAT